MKKIVVLALSGALALSLAACGSSSASTDSADSASGTASTETSDASQIPTPFTEYGTLAEATAAAGFNMTVPDSIESITDKTFLVYRDIKMIEASYESEGLNVDVRKAPIDSDGVMDISGVYTSYSNTETVALGNDEITLAGDDQLVFVATWAHDDYNFSVYADRGLEKAAMLSLIEQIQ